MHACEGYVENGRFHPMGALTQTPMRLRAVLTVLDEPLKAPPVKDHMEFWATFDKQAAASANENLRDEDFPRMTSNTRHFERINGLRITDWAE